MSGCHFYIHMHKIDLAMNTFSGDQELVKLRGISHLVTTVKPEVILGLMLLKNLHVFFSPPPQKKKNHTHTLLYSYRDFHPNLHAWPLFDASSTWVLRFLSCLYNAFILPFFLAPTKFSFFSNCEAWKCYHLVLHALIFLSVSYPIVCYFVLHCLAYFFALEGVFLLRCMVSGSLSSLISLIHYPFTHPFSKFFFFNLFK